MSRLSTASQRIPVIVRSSRASAKSHSLIVESSEHDTNLELDGAKLECRRPSSVYDSTSLIRRSQFTLPHAANNLFVALPCLDIIQARLPIFEHARTIRANHPRVVRRPDHGAEVCPMK